MLVFVRVLGVKRKEECVCGKCLETICVTMAERFTCAGPFVLCDFGSDLMTENVPQLNENFSLPLIFLLAVFATLCLICFSHTFILFFTAAAVPYCLAISPDTKISLISSEQ